MPHIGKVDPVKLLQCTGAFVLVFIAACNSSTSSTGVGSTGVGLSSDDPAGTVPLTLNSNSSLITAVRKNLYMLSALDGSTELVFEGGGRGWEFFSPADVANDVAYISSTDNILNAISLNTGELLWEFRLGRADEGGNPTVPSCSASSCYVVGGAYDLYKISIPDGELEWSVSLDRSGGATQAIGSRHPLITEQKIYVGTDYADGLYRLNVYSRNDGSLLESLDFDDQIRATPVVSDGKLLVLVGGALHTLDFSTHELIWRTEFSGLSKPVVIDQIVIATIHDPENQYVDTKFGTAGMNIDTGDVIWTNRMPLNIGGGIVPASDGSLVITATPTSDGLAFSNSTQPRALRPADGSVVWDLGTSGVTADTPLAVSGHLFYSSISLPRSGVGSGVTALDSRTGEANWIVRDGHAENVRKFSPVMVLVHDGQVFRTEEFPTIGK